MSLYEPLFRLVEAQVIGFDQLGIVKQRQGNRLAEDSPRNTYETRDGRWIGISASSQRTFDRLVRRDGYAASSSRDPRFVDNSAAAERRRAGRDDRRLVQASATATRSWRSSTRPMSSPARCSTSATSSRIRITSRARTSSSVPDDDFGHVRMQGVVPRFARHAGRGAPLGRALGADNDAIFIDELGLSRS